LYKHADHETFATFHNILIIQKQIFNWSMPNRLRTTTNNILWALSMLI